MTRDEVLNQLCILSGDVANGAFSWREAADCFCKNCNDYNYQYSRRVIKYIKIAVYEKLIEGKNYPVEHEYIKKLIEARKELEL